MKVQERYPYFSVKVQQQNEEYILKKNFLPFVISEKNSAICLNSSESNDHLVAFAFDENIISVDISHCICDGNGLIPLVKTLAYYYILKRYGNDDIDTSTIYTLKNPVQEAEYKYPFPDSPLPAENLEPYKPNIDNPFTFEKNFFDDSGVYAYYHLQIKQSDLMKFAKSVGGSPVSLVSVMLYLSTTKLFPNNKNDIVFEIPHTYRKILSSQLSHDCLARVIFAKLSPKLVNKDMATLNKIIREQIAKSCDKSHDVQTVNGLIQLDAYLKTLPLAEKNKTMKNIVASTLAKHTFGVSYTGNVSWGGMEKYVVDVHPYAGEMTRDSEISTEIFTIGDYFSICIMQPGKNPVLVNQLIKCFENIGIKCSLRGGKNFHLPDYNLSYIKKLQ